MSESDHTPAGLPVKGEALFENDYARGWLPAEPLAPEHVLIECRGEWGGLEDFVFRAGNDALAGFFRAVGQAAQSMGLSDGGYRMLAEARAPGGSGPFYVHLLPGQGPLAAANAAEAGDQGGGGLEESEIPLDSRTLVIPPQPTTEAHLTALCNGLGVSPQVGGAMLTSPLPRAVTRRPASELGPLETSLRQVGLATRVLSTRRFLVPFRPWLVERVELAGRREADGLRLFGPEGEALITFDRNGLLVVGRYSWLVEGRGSSRSGWSSTRLQTMRHTRFVHLWFAGSERPFSFVESALTGYEFLGERKEASALANFQHLIELLDDKPRVVGCYALAEHPLLVKSVADTYLSGLQRPATTSPDPSADLLSRIYFLLTLGEGEAGLPAVGGERSSTATADPPPDTLETWIGLGDHYTRMGDPESARAAFEAALRKEPTSAAALVGLSRIRTRREEALRDLSRALQSAPGDVEALCERGQLLLAMGDIQAALYDFNRAIQLRPDEPRGWRGLGAVYLARSDREGAITAFTAAIQAEPKDPRSWFRRGVLRLEREETQLGLADLAEAMRLDPGLAHQSG